MRRYSPVTCWVLGLFFAYGVHCETTSGQEPTIADDLNRAPRVALVIGNSKYLQVDSLKRLNGPTADAARMADVLTGLGFSVHGGSALVDLSEAEMEKAFKDFAVAIPSGAVVWIFYSGHGAQQDHRNYLIPVDAEGTSANDLLLIKDLDTLLGDLTERASATIVVIDACRKSPSNDHGMARPSGRYSNTLIEFPVAPGLTTDDPSLYAKTLLRHMEEEEDRRIEDLFNVTSADVQKILPVQIPQGFGSLPKTPIYLHPVPRWRLKKIVGIDNQDRPVVWQFSWRDILWGDADAWLCGAVNEGGGGGDVGRGILLHTTNQGASWVEVGRDQLHAGSGEFPWGPTGTRAYRWNDAGPMNGIAGYTRTLQDGKQRRELWLVAKTGIFRSEDNGASWERSTPRPDDLAQGQVYANFTNFANLEAFAEVYAVGWQGIAHWYSRPNRWAVELPAYSYPINAVDAVGPPESREVWAVGRSGSDGVAAGSLSSAALYHLKWPGDTWERVRPTGVEPKGQALENILLISPDNGFAVGQQGLIVKGIREQDGSWKWERIPSPVTEGLESIAYYNGVLWIVGDAGVVLASRDFGKKWDVTYLKDEEGKPVSLSRVRFFGDDGWILGNHAVFRLVKRPQSQ